MGFIDFIAQEAPNIRFGVAWVILALVASCFNTGNKRMVCMVVAAVAAMDCVLYLEYNWFGLFHQMWDDFYWSLVGVDILAIAFLVYCYPHKDYANIGKLFFLMILINAAVVEESVRFKTDYVFSQRDGSLLVLNWMVLLILYGKSDGALRIMDDLHSTAVGRFFESGIDLLRVHVGLPRNK